MNPEESTSRMTIKKIKKEIIKRNHCLLVLAKTFKSANLYKWRILVIIYHGKKNFGWEKEGLKQGHSVD